MTGELHAICLSGGKDSTALAIWLRENEPRDYSYLCTPTGNEYLEMFSHWRGLGRYFGKSLMPITAHTGLMGVMREQGMIPNHRARFCTRLLKILPYRHWLAEQGRTHKRVVNYVGLRADEPTRVGGAYDDIPGVETRFPLREVGYGIADVWALLEQTPGHTSATMAADVPERTDCRMCFHQRIGEWWLLYKREPATFDEAIAAEQEFGHTFRTPKLDRDGKPVFTEKYGHRYAACWRDSWPVRLVDLKTVFAAGHVPRTANLQPDMFRQIGSCRVCTL